MNFLIVGHSVADKIIDKGEVSVKPGGIFYTVISLLSQINSDDKVYLCSSIDKENELLFKNAYDRIEKDFLVYVESIPRVELLVNNVGERKETYSRTAKNLSLPADDVNRFDGILLNMISGYDISLNQLIQLRKDYGGLIYFDVHTLSRGVDNELNRIFRRIPNFNKWAKCIDILQTNESELLTLTDLRDEAGIVDELFSYGIKQIIITRAEKGADVFFSERNSIIQIHKDAMKTNAVNKVGCGDVFGAVYFYNYIKNKDVILALDHANLFAAVATTYSEANDFLKLKRDANERIS
jgi:sugar/nucleoside kinase (ribokinase family)